MKQPLVVRVFCSVLLSCLLGACATPAAPGFAGRWKPVNRFDPAPEEIPLAPSYVFYAAPTDRTLKAMLERWALDSKMTLRYEHPSDFTLYQAVATLRTGDLHQATAALSALYAAQRVLVSVDQNTILVRPAEAGGGDHLPAAETMVPATAGGR